MSYVIQCVYRKIMHMFLESFHVYKYSRFRSMFILAPAFLVMFLLTGFTGLVVFAYYHTKGCDPLRAGYISNSNQVRNKN